MNVAFKKIIVIGLGYIGLPTAAVLALRDIQIVGVDIDSKTVDTINSGKIHIIETDLDMIVHHVVSTGKLRAVTTVEPAEAFIITVPTPFTEGYQPDLSHINAVIESIAPVLTKGNLIILESTSPVGTTENISKQLATLRNDLIFPHQSPEKADIYMAYCPERVMPGKIIKELIDNDRIIGGITPACSMKAKSLYAQFVKGRCISTDSRTAEMSKLTENAFRDVNIAFANELSIICDKLTINVWELIKLANFHPRVNILQPGPGVGGHCIAVDPWFIVHAAPNEATLIRTAREVNNSKPLYVLEKIKQAMAPFSDPRLECLGMTYKPDTDDLRESPVIYIIEQLISLTNITVNVVEPNIKKLPVKFAENAQCKLMTLEEAISFSDVVIMMVAHNEFSILDETKLANKIFINLVNWQASEPTPLSYQHKNQKSQPISDYGLMMNSISSNIII